MYRARKRQLRALTFACTFGFRIIQGCLLFSQIQECHLSHTYGKELILHRCTREPTARAPLESPRSVRRAVMCLEVPFHAYYLTMQTAATEEIPLTAAIPGIPSSAMNQLPRRNSSPRKRAYTCTRTILAYPHDRKKKKKKIPNR